MAGLVPAIHVLIRGMRDVDARDKPAHDGGEIRADTAVEHSSNRLTGLLRRHGRACPGHPRLALLERMGGWVYIMTNRRNGTLYVGVTSNLPPRAYQHREGLVEGFTKRYGLKMLVYFEQHDDIRTAIQRERTIKHWPRAWKVRLIHGMNPDWRDLYDMLF